MGHLVGVVGVGMVLVGVCPLVCPVDHLVVVAVQAQEVGVREVG